MMRSLLVGAVVLAACHPISFTGSGGQAAAPAPVDNRTPDQVVVDLLGGNGYGCTFENETIGWRCTAPQRWTFYITQEAEADGSTQILYTTFMGRAFGKPCSAFQFAMQDLQAQGGAGFQALCNDQTLQFNLSTRWIYGSDLNVVAAANDHVDRALVASKSLRDIRALAKSDAATLVGR